MKKILEVELEEECLMCPNLSLTTDTLYADGKVYYKTHNCQHIAFCQTVREAWEKARENDG